jgi:hypothetical protein
MDGDNTSKEHPPTKELEVEERSFVQEEFAFEERPVPVPCEDRRHSIV